jgi:hypothetical protein
MLFLIKGYFLKNYEFPTTAKSCKMAIYPFFEANIAQTGGCLPVPQS